MIPKKDRPMIFLSILLVMMLMPVLMSHFRTENQAIYKRSEQPKIAPVDNAQYYEIMDWVINGTHESDILFAGFNYSIFVKIKNLDILNHSNLVLTMISNSSYLILESNIHYTLPCLDVDENRTIFVGNVFIKKSVSTYERAMLTLYVTDETLLRQEFCKVYNLHYSCYLTWSCITWFLLNGDRDYEFENGEGYEMIVNITNRGMKPAFNVTVDITCAYGKIDFWTVGEGQRTLFLQEIYPNQTVRLPDSNKWRFSIKSGSKNSYEYMVLCFKVNGLDHATTWVYMNLNPSSSSNADSSTGDPSLVFASVILVFLMFGTLILVCLRGRKRNIINFRDFGPDHKIDSSTNPPIKFSSTKTDTASKDTSHQTQSPGENNVMVREYSRLERLTEENQGFDTQIARLLGEQGFEKALVALEAKRKNLHSLGKDFQDLNLTKTRSILDGEMDRTRHQILNVKASSLQNQVNSATSLADYCTIGDRTRELIREVRQFIVERRERDTGRRSQCEMLHLRLKELLETNDYALRYYQLEARYKEMHKNIVKKQFFGQLLSMPSLDEDLAALILDLKHSASKSEMQRDLLCAAEAIQIQVEILPQQMDLKISNRITCKNDPTFNQTVEEGFPRLKIAKINLLGSRSCRQCSSERIDGAKYCPNCGEILDE